MITAYVGKPGSGKTFLMTKHLIQEMNRGRDVLSNYPIRRARYMEDLDQALNFTKGIIAVDELHLLAPTNKRWSLPVEYARLWSQGRHMEIDFFYTTQKFHRIDPQIRDLTSFAWECKRIIGPLHVAYLYDADDIERKRRKAKAYEKHYFLIKKSVYSQYKRYNKINLAKHLQSSGLGGVDIDTLPVFDEKFDLVPRQDFKHAPETSSRI